jgi:SEC-C motif-containing protein
MICVKTGSKRGTMNDSSINPLHKEMPCPCHSGQLYTKCCKIFHDRKEAPKDALLLMRSRYAAYALSLPLYIIETTHPDHPSAKRDLEEWKEEILLFYQNTKFENLEIIQFIPGTETAYVIFKASLSQNEHDCSFTEKSLFKKNKKRWLYRDAIYVKPLEPFAKLGR